MKLAVLFKRVCLFLFVLVWLHNNVFIANGHCCCMGFMAAHQKAFICLKTSFIIGIKENSFFKICFRVCNLNG